MKTKPRFYKKAENLWMCQGQVGDTMIKGSGKTPKVAHLMYQIRLKNFTRKLR